MDQETKQWLDFAVQDLGVARHLFDTYYPKPLEIICYHCQQAAEKALKAVIISNGCPGGLPKVHDLSFLLGQMKNYVQIDDLYYDCADALTPYGVSVRYPNELSLEEHHAAEAIKQASIILGWTKSLIL
jgi:HEPN domain-containing protein